VIESPGVESPTLVWTNDIDTHDAGLNPNAKLPTTTEPGIAVVSAALSVHPGSSQQHNQPGKKASTHASGSLAGDPTTPQTPGSIGSYIFDLRRSAT